MSMLLFSRTGGIVTNDSAALPLLPLVERFLAEKAGNEENTWRASKTALKNLYLPFLADLRGARKLERLCLAEFTTESVEAYVKSRLIAGDKPSTVCTRLALIKSFGSWLEERLKTYKSPAKSVRGPKVESAKWVGLAEKQWRAIEEAAQKTGNSEFLRARNGLMISVYIRTGLRASEVTLITERQLQSDHISDVWTKGKKFRRIYISPLLQESLTRYLGLRKALLASCGVRSTMDYPLFIANHATVKGDPESFRISYSAIHRVMSQAAALGLGHHVNPHRLRHTFGRELYRKTKDIRAVCAALGHSDIKITMRYTEPAQEELDKVIAEAFE